MQNLKLIVWREFITRVRKRSFILGTLLAPLGLLVYFLVIIGLSSYSGGGELKVAVLDEADMLGPIPDDKGVHYIPAADRSLDELKKAVEDGTYNGILRIPALGNMQQKNLTVFYYSDKKLPPEKSEFIEDRIEEKLRDFKIDSLGIDRRNLDVLDTKVAIDPEKLDGSEDDQSQYTAAVGLAIGGIMAFVMFFMVLMYGQMVMRSVMEEKTNRIVEVMMSSVKPFELMLGKILGVGAVGLTQVLSWTVLSTLVTLLVPMIMDIDPQQLQQSAPAGAGAAQINPEEAQAEGLRIFAELSKQNWGLIAFAFTIFFLGGYFIYSSLFAAIGSAMSDDMGEGQALTLPVTLPIVLAFYITAFAGIRNPDSGLMVFTSLFPLFSPIAMPFRMAFDPPWWQVALSLVLVVAAAVFFVWLAGRIYRVGILMYGKKVTLREIGKWMLWK